MILDTVVDVNGHSDAAQVAAFLRALEDRPPSGDGGVGIAASSVPVFAAHPAQDRAPLAPPPTQGH